MSNLANSIPPRKSTAARLAESLVMRLALLALLLVADKLLITGASGYGAQALQGAAERVHLVHTFMFHALLAFAASLFLFAYVRGGLRLRSELFPDPGAPIAARWLMAHLPLVVAMTAAMHYLYRDLSPLPFAFLLGTCIALALAAVLTAFRAMAPWTVWRRMARALGILWLYAGVTALVSTAAIDWSEKFWPHVASVTFAGVYHLLAPFIPSLHSDPQQLLLTTDRIAVHVAPSCSGVEGATLILVFCTLWLLCFRREYRFPRALLLIPAGLALMFALNILRIATLLVIAHNGHPAVAVYGFHSQAGWITFTGGAGVLALVSRRSIWLSQDTAAVQTSADNPTAAYLLPFLGILAAGMLAHAASSGFELLYPLRIAACGLALWTCRARLARLDWRCTWRGPAVGVAVFALWVAAGHYLLGSASEPAGLAKLSPTFAALWIGARALGGIVAAPVAEELAFRGFLLRRWQAADFESLPFQAVRWLPLLLTSVLFGLSHGGMWALGIIAGGAYGALLIASGRFGECVAAHATTNALLALLVLAGGQWQFW